MGILFRNEARVSRFGNHNGGGTAAETTVLQCEDVSTEVVAKILKDAYFDVTTEPNGALRVKDNYNYYLFVDKDRGVIRYQCAIRLNEASTQESRLKYVNHVNSQIMLIRATTFEKVVLFDYFLPTQGGVNPKTIVLAFKRFASCLFSAIQANTEHVLG